MHGKNTTLIVVLLLVLAAGLAYRFFPVPPDAPAARPGPMTSTAESAASDGKPRYPVPDMRPGGKPLLRPLPDLNDSDQYLRLDIAGVFGEAIAEITIAEQLIERLVATIDNLPRQSVAERVRPVAPLATAFAVTGQDDSGQFVLGEDNYQRYDELVAQLESVSVDEMVELYRRYYPLFQKAYEGLGYPGRYFNDRLVFVLDHLLDTPEVSGTVMLVRPHVLYEFDDETLEALSGGQKLLVRIGPAHRAVVMPILRQFREMVAFDK